MESVNGTTSAVYYMRMDRDRNGSLCGMPGFCAENSYNACYSTPLYKCDKCSVVAAGAALVVLIVIASAIVVGNSMVIASVFCNGKRGRTKMGFVKASLAVADLINGGILFFVVIPNIVWSLGVSAQQLDAAQLRLQDSPIAFAGSFFFCLSYVASIDHLNFLAIERWYAIKWPFRWRAQGESSTKFWVVVIWAEAIVTCLIPVMRRDIFLISYVHSIFLYEYQFKIDGKYATIIETSLVVAFVVLPFLTMTFFTVWSGLLVCTTSRKSKSLRLERDRAKLMRKEVAICKSLLLMELGFTFTMLPGSVWLVLFYLGKIQCDETGIPLIFGIILASSNSLVNVAVYSFRDDNFVEVAKKFASAITCKHATTRETKSLKLSGNSNKANRRTDMQETGIRD